VVVVMMVMVVRMVMASGKSRRGKDHQQESGCKNLLHAMNVAR
jgi:uncharacterized membrane protein